MRPSQKASLNAAIPPKIIFFIMISKFYYIFHNQILRLQTYHHPQSSPQKPDGFRFVAQLNKSCLSRSCGIGSNRKTTYAISRKNNKILAFNLWKYIT
jgi:hypothetical protein